MVQISGCITVMCVDEEFAKEEGWSTTSDAVIAKLTSLLDGNVAKLINVVQNAMHGISVFDFSNHDDGRSREALEQCDQFLSSLRRENFPVNWHFDYLNEETGDYLIIQSKQHWR